MVANTWIAAGPGDWSDDANWSLGHSPIAGEDPTFDGTSVNNCAANDDTPCGVLTIAAGYSGTITQSSDMYISGYSQAGGTFTGVTTKWVYCSGPWLVTAGSISNNVVKINFTGSGNVNFGGTPYQLIVSDNAHITLIGTYSVRHTIINYGIITINIGITLTAQTWTGGTLQNYGEINGLGTFVIQGYANTYSLNLYNGYYNVAVSINANSGTTGNVLFNLISSNNNINSLSLTSLHTTYTCTLNLNGHSLTATTITIGTRGILSNSAATDSVVTCRTFDSSNAAATFTPTKIKVVTVDSGTVTTKAGDTFVDLTLGSMTALGSDIAITGEAVIAGNQANGVRTITHTGGGDKWYDRRRVHIKKESGAVNHHVRPGDVAMSYLSKEVAA